MCAYTHIFTLVIYMIDYKNIDIGDVVIEINHGRPYSYSVVLEEYEEGLFRVVCMQEGKEYMLDIKFDSEQLGRSYEIIKPNK